MPSIDEFKSMLTGGGARANQFRVTIPFPNRISIALDITKTSFLCSAASLPGMTLGEIVVPFRGRNIYIAGDRPEFEVWTTTFFNDTDFMIRTALERWNNGINDLKTNLSIPGVTDPSPIRGTLGYEADLTVEQLDRDGASIKTYIFRNAYPLTIGPIELASATVNELETFEVTWRYHWFESEGVNF